MLDFKFIIYIQTFPWWYKQKADIEKSYIERMKEIEIKFSRTYRITESNIEIISIYFF